MVEPWSKVDTLQWVKEYKPNENKVILANGKEYSYKALVLCPGKHIASLTATGFNHKDENLEGLLDVQDARGENNIFVHAIDEKTRLERNYYHGWNHQNGDMICYSPKAPYKGEGSDFYALYYEHLVRQDNLQGRAANNARIQYWSPNEYIYEFPYANEIALEECHKRGIEVFLGWEMTKVYFTDIGVKMATFKNVHTGETIEKEFQSAVINPPSKPHKELLSSGIA